MEIDLIFGVLVLIFSVVLHEVAHGYMANYLGDPTAKLQGRLTLNPISHIDPIGTILLPLILVITRAPILIGYAKPVPYNPYNLSGKYDEALVAGAGPATNIFLALIFGLSLRFIDPESALASAFATVTFINILLALFNLLPFPPLDGSKIFSTILPGALGRAYENFRISFERLGVLTGTLIILLLFYFFSPVFFGFIRGVFAILTGVSI